ncbi:MAG: hypothetical protein PF638_14115 [Candidatus Delongbacteria bacterium]|jgi:hypothetical protein|nr:hypothetical protein [Candidatus Delongbacteria bacterium]
MKKQKTVIVGVIFLFLTSIFAMSDDGNNEPTTEKKEVKQVIIQEKQPVITTEKQLKQSNSNELVKDRLGGDTGKTKEELTKFKLDYTHKFVKLFPNFRESAKDWFFDNKINLNKIVEFEKNGLYLKKLIAQQGTSYQRNTLFSDIIVTGKVVELIKKGETFVPRYKFEIEQIINGSEVFKEFLGEIPKYIYFVAFFGVSIEDESFINKKGIYFLEVEEYTKSNMLFHKLPYSTVMVYNDSLMCHKRDFYKFDTAYKYKHGKLELSKMQKDNNYGEKYLRWYDECKTGSWNETIENIKKTLKINDDKNFYNRTYKSKEK